MQIMTIEALLKGARPDLPPLAIDAGFRRAEREDRSEQDQGLLPMLDVAPVSKTRAGRVGKELRI